MFCKKTRNFMEKNNCPSTATNVANVFQRSGNLNSAKVLMKIKILTNVIDVTNVSKENLTYKHTSSFIVKKKHTDANFVKNDFCKVVICVRINVFTVGNQLLHALHAGNVSCA